MNMMEKTKLWIFEATKIKMWLHWYLSALQAERLPKRLDSTTSAFAEAQTEGCENEGQLCGPPPNPAPPPVVFRQPVSGVTWAGSAHSDCLRFWAQWNKKFPCRSTWPLDWNTKYLASDSFPFFPLLFPTPVRWGTPGAGRRAGRGGTLGILQGCAPASAQGTQNLPGWAPSSGPAYPAGSVWMEVTCPPGEKTEGHLSLNELLALVPEGGGH